MSTTPTSLALTTIADNSQIIASSHRNNYSAVQTAVNSLISFLSAGTTSQFVQSGGGTTINWAGAYTDYTPTWTASGTAPAIGNAVVVARYLQIGKLIHAYGSITFGTTSTYGTGTWKFALPVTASANAIAGQAAGQGFLQDVSANAILQATYYLPAGGATMSELHGATYAGTATTIGQTAPWTWAQSDVVSWNILYEAA